MALGDFVTGYVHRPVTVSPNSVVHKETFNAFFSMETASFLLFKHILLLRHHRSCHAPVAFAYTLV